MAARSLDVLQDERWSGIGKLPGFFKLIKTAVLSSSLRMSEIPGEVANSSGFIAKKRMSPIIPLRICI